MKRGFADHPQEPHPRLGLSGLAASTPLERALCRRYGDGAGHGYMVQVTLMISNSSISP